MIYLDHAATTPLNASVRAAMLPWLDDVDGYGNPASDHVLGRRARAAVESARAQVAALIGAEAGEIVWTSGATEANNLALKGALEFRGLKGAHVVSSRIEHKAVLDTCRYLETQGTRVTYLTPDRGGRISVEQVMAALQPDTALVSLMWVNNETGVINPVVELAPLLRARGVLFHVDAVQAAGKLAIDLSQLPIDLLSLSAHKLYGPKGVGALFVRKRPRARLAPQIHGGGHEQGMRSGTLATHQIVGMGAACALAQSQVDADANQQHGLRERLWVRLQTLSRIHRNGAAVDCAPHILNVSFEGVDGEALRASLPGLAVSSGSACSSATREPSYVLRALGRDDELAGASLRLSPGRSTTADQVDRAADEIIAMVHRLRAVSPTWVGEADGEGAAVLIPFAAADNVYAYPAPVWAAFGALRHAGVLPAGDDVVCSRAGSPAAHAQLELSARCAPDGTIQAARFRAYGCPTTIAVGEWLASQIEVGFEAGKIPDTARDLRSALEIGEDKAHCALMGEDVLRALFDQIQRIRK